MSKEKVYIFLLAAIQFIHIVDFVVLMPLGPIIMSDLGINPTQFALLISSYNFSAAFSGLVFASVADRFNRKTLLIYTLLAFTVSALICGVSPNFQVLLFARILTGAFGGILTSLTLIIVSDLISYQRRGGAMGVIMSSFSIASVFGIPIGLFLAEQFEWRSTFLAVAITSVFILILSSIIFPTLKVEKKSDDFWQSLKSYLKPLTNIFYLQSFSLIFIAALSMFMIFPFLSPYAVKNIGILIEDLKYMYFFGGIATMGTSIIFGRLTDKIGGEKLFMILCFLSLIPVILYTHAGAMGLVPFIAMSTLFMTIVSGRMIPCMTVLSQVPKSHDRGSYMALLNSVRSLGASFATFISGVMITQAQDGSLIGFDRVGYLSVTLILISIFLMFQIFYRPKIREQENFRNESVF